MADLRALPEHVCAPDEQGFVRWPDGGYLAAGNDGKTALGRDGKVLQADDGEPLLVAADTQKPYLESHRAFVVAVYASGEAAVLTAVPKGPQSSSTEADLYVDGQQRLFTRSGQRVVTSGEGGKVLASKDGRAVVAHADGKLTLTDGTGVARGPDGQPAQWIDGSAVLVGADDRSVVGADGRVLRRNGAPVDVSPDGRVKDSVGTYVINTPEPPQMLRAPGTPQSLVRTTGGRHQSPDVVHTRSVQLKEALNNANIELRGVKEALDATQDELRAERARSHAAAVPEDTPQYAELRRRLEEKEDELQRLRHASADAAAALQRRVDEASADDAAALHRLQLAVDSQTRRVAAREDEVAALERRAASLEEQRARAEEAVAEERARHGAEYETLARTHRTVSEDYATLRARLHEVEERDRRETAELQADCRRLKALVEELSRNNMQLEEALAICDRTGAEGSMHVDAELAHCRHMLELEAGKRDRAEASLAEARRQHEAHCEEAMTQLASATVDRDRLTRMLREKERQADEAKWEKEAQVKENQRLKSDAGATQSSQAEMLEQKLVLETELRKEREGRTKELKQHLARIQELQEEKSKALRLIPETIADAERAKAVAEERVKALQRQLAEAEQSVDEYRRQAAATRSERDAMRSSFSERTAVLEKEMTRVRRTEEAYRHDREAIEGQLSSQLSTTSEMEADMERLRREAEKAERRRGKLERKLDQKREAAAQEGARAGEFERERAALHSRVAELEQRLQRDRDERDGCVEGLRLTIQHLQDENCAIIAERQQAAVARMQAAQSVSRQIPPTPSPAWVDSPGKVLATAATTTAGLPQSRTTSPPRCPTVSTSEVTADMLNFVIGPDYARLVRSSLARNHPPVSPPTPLLPPP